MPSGIGVVAGIRAGRPVGMTCRAMFFQSLEPPLLVFSPSLVSTTWPVLAEEAELAVSILAKDQAGMARVFARPSVDRFAGIDWHPSPITGSPVLTGSHVALDCRARSSAAIGDHYLIVADLVAVETDGDVAPRNPVILYGSTFHELGPRLEEVAAI